jgi:hypothetical protein
MSIPTLRTVTVMRGARGIPPAIPKSASRMGNEEAITAIPSPRRKDLENRVVAI